MIAEIAQYPDGTIVPLPVSGTVKTAFDIKTGEGQYGPWAMQGFILAAPDGEISVTLTGDPSSLQQVQKGDQVELAARPNTKGVLSGVKKETYVNKQTGQGKVQLKVSADHLRNLSRAASVQSQAYAPQGGAFATSVPAATLQYPAPAPAGAPIGSHMEPNPASASVRPATGVPTPRTGILSESEARKFLLRQYRELGNALGAWDAPGDALQPEIHVALMAWCTSLFDWLNQGKIEAEPAADAPQQGRPDPW